jgi:VIT1/CCC1 family predicted Fe2+/Mn2+ transporter
MRQISSRQREESASGRPDDAADASLQVATRPEWRTPRSFQSPTAPKDFTAQVMARLSTPLPPPDPGLKRKRQVRARAGLVARVYVTLVLVAAVAVVLLALIAPWALVAAVVSVISAALLVLGAVAFVGRATGGFISGLGVVYAAMLAALTPSLLMLAHRFRRQRPRLHQ